MKVSVFVTAAFSLLSIVLAESNTITFENNCGHGTPTLRASDGTVLSTGGPFTSNGPLEGAIAYLTSDEFPCGNNGEGCTFIELTLLDGGNSADISLIPPHTFSDGAGFFYTGSCQGQGAYCGEASCNTAFKQSDDTCVQVGCSGDSVGLTIQFCGGTTGFTGGVSSPGSPCP